MKRRLTIIAGFGLTLLVAAACTAGGRAASEDAGEDVPLTQTPNDESEEVEPTARPEHDNRATSVTGETIEYPEDWRDMPVVPEVTDTAREVYALGQEMGRDPHRFSIIGDCQNVSSHFLGAFDDPNEYSLGTEYAYLQDTIDWYAGSFTADRAAVRGGYNVASLVDFNRTNLALCTWGETPLECEFRLNNPSVAVISLETNFDEKSGETYARYMRQIVAFSIEQGVVPILATKADNLEGDNSINAAIVEVAQEYDVPLWNFWASVQDLPNGGLEHEEGGDFHLTWARPFFDDPARMQNAWPIRNLTALQSLDAVRNGVSDETGAPLVAAAANGGDAN